MIYRCHSPGLDDDDGGTIFYRFTYYPGSSSSEVRTTQRITRSGFDLYCGCCLRELAGETISTVKQVTYIYIYNYIYGSDL